MSRVSRLFAVLAAMLMVFVTGGCSTTPSGESTSREQGQAIIIDRPTPSGEVEAPREVVPVQPYRPSPPADYSGGGDDAALQGSITTFRETYAKNGRPRIALYVNRALSGDPREWQSDTRTTIGYGETQTTTDGSGTSRTTTSGGISISDEVRYDDSGSVWVNDSWAWQLEDAVRAPLLQAGANVVDRDVILRMAAAAEGHTAHEDLAIKRLEMDALKGKADILAQIVISPHPDPKLGHVFRTEVFDVDSGSVLVSVSSASWPRTRQVKGQWVATSTGYEKTGIPDPQQLGSYLAQDLMRGLSNSP